MAETEQEKLRKRREARQRRILASAGDRLSRITSTARGDAKSEIASQLNQPAPAVLAASSVPSSPRDHSFNNNQTSTANATDSTSTPLSGQSNLTSSTASQDGAEKAEKNSSIDDLRQNSTAFAQASPITRNLPRRSSVSTHPPSPSDSEDDLLIQARVFREQLETQQQALLNEHHRTQGTLNPEQLFNLAGISPDSGLFGATGSEGQKTAQVEKEESSFSRNWKFVHLGIAILLGLWIVLGELLRKNGGIRRFGLLAQFPPEEVPLDDRVSSSSIFWWFITIELILQSTSIAFFPTKEITSDIMRTLVAVLPPAVTASIQLILGYRSLYQQCWRDMSVLLFIVGMCIGLSKCFSSMV
ncbi:uncharacterized protein VTP21DRAFT_351 [Calcarisporiella thermophila]|uniref:uncharacterized protein n=1 Tax=Calcarisporiella thermophila TaxID=911321 RepID=UPI00374496A2